MAGINTGSSFMSKLGGQMPGMVNSLAEKYGNPSMRGSVQGSSSLLARQKSPMRRPMTPNIPVQSGLPSGPIGTNIQAPGLVPPGEINAQMPAIDTGPSPNAPLFQNPYANIFNQSPGYGRTGNTGIAGGLFNRPPGYERPDMGAGGIDIGGLFGAFNRFSRPQTNY